MNTVERHTQAYEDKTIPRLDADFWLYRTLWVELGPIRSTLVFWSVRVWGGWMYGKRRTSNNALKATGAQP
jgi:hypothetical protein